MALPPPPKSGSEMPNKPFGPILTRSLMDLQSEVAEIHSRCSRTNCEFPLNRDQTIIS
jgi:hypothetical protein